jgi:hypothetical protein
MIMFVFTVRHCLRHYDPSHSFPLSLPGGFAVYTFGHHPVLGIIGWVLVMASYGPDIGDIYTLLLHVVSLIFVFEVAQS